MNKNLDPRKRVLDGITKTIARGNNATRVLNLTDREDAVWLLKQGEPVIYPYREEMVYVPNPITEKEFYGKSVWYQRRIDEVTR